MRRLLIALLPLALLAAAPPTVSQMRPYLHPQRLVNVGGRRMNIYCIGKSKPTVILDAGLGDSSEVWYKVQPTVAQRARVCSYDRAGMGFSDGTLTRRDPNAVVADLHALLHNAGIAPPFVLVGHSIAGLYEPLYADRYPSEVAGMVLVDPSRPYQRKRRARVAPAMVAELAEQLAQGRRCYAYLRKGHLTPRQAVYCGFPTPAQQSKTCAKEGPGLCAVDRVEFAQALHPLFWYDADSELRSNFTDLGSAEVQRAQRSYGTMPLIVLTADEGPHHDTGLPSNVPPVQARAWWNVLKQMHDELARTSSVGVDFVVSGTGHYIQLDQPAVVVSAIDEVLMQARAR
jgi:pimeloyl-ACP methyl ester carboxylesterase